ncbi:MAG: DUF2066 domain-containing protein [Rhodospirillales bacterium]|nr:DUF2066 domain-containing protein [Rhodospirillales bacterium]
MSRFYKKLPRLILVFSFCASFLMGIGGTAYAQGSDAFTVTGVHVDVTADDAVAAREQAFQKAQVQAFQELAARLLTDAQAAALTPPAPDVVSSLIQDFEITEERLSAVRYVGTYIFRFKNDAVRKYFSGYGVSYTDVSSKPVLILPFYQWGTRMVIWEDNNPWRQAWNRSGAGYGLVPVVVPIGDLQDVAAINDDTMLTYDAQKMAEMMERYGTGDGVIVLAAPEPEGAETPAGLNITIYRTELIRPVFVQNFHVNAPEDGDVFAAAVMGVRRALQKDWKDKTLVESNLPQNSLKARVRYSSMKEWVDTQKSLRSVQGVSDVKLQSLTPRQADIELVYRGTEDRLRLALEQADMTLTLPESAMPTDPYGLQYGYRPAANTVYDLYLNKYAPAPPIAAPENPLEQQSW